MDFETVDKSVQTIVERRVSDIVRDWAGKGGFRDTYLKNFATKGQDFANREAEKWLGSIEDFKGADDLKKRLMKSNMYIAKTDDPLLKIVQLSADKVEKSRKEALDKRASLAAREQEIRGNQLVDAPKASIS
jgi:hypothetical protein